MPYPDRLLAEDEQVVKHLHPHWLTLVVPVFFFLVIVGLGTFAALVVPDGSSQQWLQLAIGVIGVVLLFWLVLIPFLRWKTTHYVITTHRVLIRTGVLNHVGRDINLQRINDVAFEQTLFDRLIGAGTLQVESAGESGQTVLKNIPHSDEVQQIINRLVEEYSQRTYGGQNYQDEDPGDTRRFR